MSKKQGGGLSLLDLFRTNESDAQADRSRIVPSGTPEVIPTKTDNQTLSWGGLLFGNRKDYKKGAKRDRK